MARKTPEVPHKISITHETVIKNKPDEGDLPGRPSRMDDIQGVQILYRGANPDMRIGEEAEQFAAAESLVPYLLEIGDLAAAAQPFRDIVTGAVKGIGGYRGIERRNDQGYGYRLSVSLPETISYKDEGLREGLGALYDDVVTSTEAVITTVVPKGINPELFVGAMAIVLNALGIDKQDVPQYLSAVIKHCVDEGKLQELMAKNNVELPEGTREVKYSTPRMLPPKLIGPAETKGKPQQESSGE